MNWQKANRDDSEKRTELFVSPAGIEQCYGSLFGALTHQGCMLNNLSRNTNLHTFFISCPSLLKREKL